MKHGRNGWRKCSKRNPNIKSAHACVPLLIVLAVWAQSIQPICFSVNQSTPLRITRDPTPAARLYSAPALSGTGRRLQAQHSCDPDRRPGVFGSGVLGWGDPDPKSGPDCRSGVALYPILQNRPVLPDAGKLTDGALSASGCHRVYRAALRRVGGIPKLPLARPAVMARARCGNREKSDFCPFRNASILPPVGFGKIRC